MMTIKEYRKSAGLTQKQFADLFDISIDTVKAWDCGRRKPDKLKERLIIKELEKMIGEKEMREELWSVELEATFWTDDIFNGTYDECVEYCRQYDYKIDGNEARLAKILVEDGCVIETLEIVDDLD